MSPTGKIRLKGRKFKRYSVSVTLTILLFLLITRNENGTILSYYTFQKNIVSL